MIAYGIDSWLVDGHDCETGLIRPNTLVSNGDVAPTRLTVERDLAFVSREVDRCASLVVSKFNVDGRLIVRLRDDVGGESTLAKFAIRTTAYR
ncbi:hypothetical protein C441_16359 [Haloferax sulfurifontis ATCC BAA-897]|uniref:Uncharacterized protein n=1 Tax=Haloferax sulfurifontis ATCC BAA-897 TaxID=662480 RepID=M0HWW6_9EURY|nr:hypothetical protein C441_16359 [Haloferax sulfurifontis ATCC BAA-897]